MSVAREGAACLGASAERGEMLAYGALYGASTSGMGAFGNVDQALTRIGTRHIKAERSGF